MCIRDRFHKGIVDASGGQGLHEGAGLQGVFPQSVLAAAGMPDAQARISGVGGAQVGGDPRVVLRDAVAVDPASCV